MRPLAIDAVYRGALTSRLGCLILKCSQVFPQRNWPNALILRAFGKNPETAYVQSPLFHRIFFIAQVSLERILEKWSCGFPSKWALTY